VNAFLSASSSFLVAIVFLKCSFNSSKLLTPSMFASNAKSSLISGTTFSLTEFT
jgi:hypothetical protein